jgi:N utilization substance protein B
MTKTPSSGLRRRARTVALQSLFAADVRGNQAEWSLSWLADENPLPPRFLSFAEQLIFGVRDRLAELDRIVQQYAPAWPVDQLSVVDRNILRIALFELLHCQETPKKTAVNEAVELAKLFGSESSARFVNGVLGSVMLDLEAGELAPQAPEGR